MSKIRFLLCAVAVTAIVAVPAAAQAAQPTGFIPVGRFPADVVLSPDGSEAFVVNREDGTVSVIEVATRAVDRTITDMGAPLDLAVAADGTVYATQNDQNASEHTVIVAGPGATTATGSFPVSAFAQEIALAPDDATVWVSADADADADADDGIVQLDVADGSVRGTFLNIGVPSDLVVDAQGVVYATFEDADTIAIIRGDQLVRSDSLTAQQNGLAVSADTAWVSAGPATGAGTLTQVNVVDGTVGWTVAVGILPGPAAVDANGYIYVPGLYSDEVTVVSPTGTVVDQIETPAQSGTFGVAVAGDVGFVSLADIAQVAVFDLYEALEEPEDPGPSPTTPTTATGTGMTAGGQLAVSGASGLGGAAAIVGSLLVFIGAALRIRSRRHPAR